MATECPTHRPPTGRQSLTPRLSTAAPRRSHVRDPVRDSVISTPSSGPNSRSQGGFQAQQSSRGAAPTAARPPAARLWERDEDTFIRASDPCRGH